MTGGEALNPDVRDKWKSQTGLELHEGYGQSETVSWCPRLPHLSPLPIIENHSPAAGIHLSLTPVRHCMGSRGHCQ